VGQNCHITTTRHEPASKQYHDAMKNRKIAILSDTVVQRHTTNATVKQHSCGHRLRKDYATPGCDAHLGFTGLEPAVGLRPALWTADHTSSIACRYLPGFYTGTKLHYLMTEAHGCEQLAQSRHMQQRPAVDRTRDLLSTSPTPYHCATTSQCCCLIKFF